MTVKIHKVETAKDFGIAKQLLVEYIDQLEVDLSFQHLDEEFNHLRDKYTLPQGCLLLAYEQDSLVGCVAFQKLDNNICEMKRLYVRPQFRGRKIGKALTLAIIEQARKAGYQSMRLDFVRPRVAEHLYRSLGFKEIQPYDDIPLENAVFMELSLL